MLQILKDNIEAPSPFVLSTSYRDIKALRFTFWFDYILNFDDVFIVKELQKLNFSESSYGKSVFFIHHIQLFKSNLGFLPCVGIIVVTSEYLAMEVNDWITRKCLLLFFPRFQSTQKDSYPRLEGPEDI